MSQAFRNVVSQYQAGNFEKALTLVLPLIRHDSAPVELLLVAGQCCAKTNRSAEAADHYGRAAAKGGPKQAMFRAMQAEMLARADDMGPALAAARKAVKTMDFDRDALATFRSFLHGSFSIDERIMEDQAFLDRLRSGDERYFEVEQHLAHVSWCADEAINARITCGQHKGFYSEESRTARRSHPHAFGERIRIGYLSNDFSDQHPTMLLFQSALIAHDREKYDITLFCYTEDALIRSDSGMRARYPEIVQIGDLDDDAAAALIRSRGIDVLVDLKGHTKGVRMGILNRGAAPIQVAYLGFPGSGVGIDCDYVIGDPIVLPESARPHYHEKFCLMPESYQANDNVHRPLPQPVSRKSLGLPEDRIVFGSFNAIRKITPQTVELWRAVLTRVPDSVLWMMCQGAFAQENFLKWMEREGVARDRIIFAKPAVYGEHLARLPAVDICLDSFPYNGHTTTSDALWAGVPVPTWRGTHFASRVSASLVSALDMPDLVAADEDAYVDLCVRLAGDHALRNDMRRRIAENRMTAPLFDSPRFARHLETAFEMMVARARAGEAPDHITVPPLPRTA